MKEGKKALLRDATPMMAQKSRKRIGGAPEEQEVALGLIRRG
jgi:hypothetical protein